MYMYQSSIYLFIFCVFCHLLFECNCLVDVVQFTLLLLLQLQLYLSGTRAQHNSVVWVELGPAPWLTLGWCLLVGCSSQLLAHHTCFCFLLNARLNKISDLRNL